MKIKPILFSTEMVRAILAGRKTQTRRIIKETPGVCMFCGCTDTDCRKCIKRTGAPCSWINKNETICSACSALPTHNAKYQKGDILWVRETWNNWPVPAHPFVYRATDLRSCGHTWKPSIYMPKKAARIFLKVAGVRAERLLCITRADAIAEGISRTKGRWWTDYNDINNTYVLPKNSFMSLWESINGRGSVDKNPWVWVYDFERCERPNNFLEYRISNNN